MKYLIYAFCVFCALMGTNTHAQQADYSTAEKFYISKMGSVMGSRSVNPNFINRSDCFWFEFDDGEGKVYYYVNPAKGVMEPLFDHEAAAQALSELTGKKQDPRQLKLGMQFNKQGDGFTSFVDKVKCFYSLTDRVWSIPKEEKPKGRTPWKTPGMYVANSDSTYSIFCRNHNLWLKHPGETDDKAVQLTTDGEIRFSYSDDELITDNRVFTAKGHWIVGTHKFLSMRTDNRRVLEQLPILNSLHGRPHVKYSTASIHDELGENRPAGEKNVPQFHYSLVDADTRTVKPLPIERWKDQLVEPLYTTKDGRYVYLQRMNRRRSQLDLLRLDVQSGDLEVVLHEESPTYLDKRHLVLKFFNADREFLWWSDRTGQGHYYLYAADGTLKGAVTEGEWMAETIVNIDEKKREAIISAYGREEGIHPYYTYYYRVKIDGKGKKIKLITPENATHDIKLTPSGKYFVDNFSRVDMAPVAVLRSIDGKMVCRLGEANLKPLYDMGWKMPEQFTVDAADGKTKLYGVMWKPFNFDPTKKYPIISYVYPGPPMDALDTRFTITSNHNMALAQVGFIVVNFGHRGGNLIRGTEYRTFGYGNIRDYPLADDKYGIEQLARRFSFIDSTRVGIFGHSAGGMMAAAAICTYPDFYKVSIAASGCHDQRIGLKHWVESFHGIDEVTNQKGEAEFKLNAPTNMELAGNLKGHLLLVSGDEDTNVHVAHTLRMADALIKAGKQFDMYILPGQKHQYVREADVFYRHKVWFYFGEHLLGDQSAKNMIDINGFDNK